jgi:hypothetical protein
MKTYKNNIIDFSTIKRNDLLIKMQESEGYEYSLYKNELNRYNDWLMFMYLPRERKAKQFVIKL